MTISASTINLTKKAANRPDTHFPTFLGVSIDGKKLYVAENLADSVAVVDLASGKITQRLATERYPYGVAVAKDGSVYVSSWGGSTVSIFQPGGGALKDGGRVSVGRHPSALALSDDGSRLFVASASTDRVAVVDTRAKRVIATLDDPAPAGPHEGSTPNALALSHDGRRLFVAEADNNAVAVFDLSGAAGAGRLAGRIPVEWYPSAVAVAGDSLFVVNGKGRGAGPNLNGPQPNKPEPRTSRLYTLGQLAGTMTMMATANASPTELASFSKRVASANGWDGSTTRPKYPP